MSPNFQALCYLAAWEKQLPIEGGMSWASELRAFKLDYSWGSLERIDLFLDDLRARTSPVYEEFLDHQANVNLLLFLAFYVVELRSRVAGVPHRWVTYQEALKKDPATEVYGAGFHSFLISEYTGGQFLPLVSICTRLFEEEPDKSVAFSAGLQIKVPTDENQSFGPLTIASLIPDFSQRYQELEIPSGYRRWIESPVPADAPSSEPLTRLRADALKLLRSGRVVWGAIVQANSALFEPTFYGTAPGELVYDPKGRVDRIDLYQIARRLHQLRDEQPQDPDLAAYSAHLQAETTRMFGWRTPSTLYPYELLASTTFFQAEVNFPGYVIASPLIPILVSDECPGSIIPAPWQLWPKEIFEEWNDMLRSKYGDKAKIHSQPSSNPASVATMEGNGSHLRRGVKCPKCGYERKPVERVQEGQCPYCGIFYAKYRAPETPKQPVMEVPETEAQEEGDKVVSFWLLLPFLVVFFFWVYFYFTTIFPQFNHYLFQHHVHSYPAAVHVIPVLGIPILVMYILYWLTKRRSED